MHHTLHHFLSHPKDFPLSANSKEHPQKSLCNQTIFSFLLTWLALGYSALWVERCTVILQQSPASPEGWGLPVGPPPAPSSSSLCEGHPIADSAVMTLKEKQQRFSCHFSALKYTDMDADKREELVSVPTQSASLPNSWHILLHF